MCARGQIGDREWVDDVLVRVRAGARAPTPRSLPRHVQFMRRDKLCFPPFATGIRSFVNSPHVIFIFLYIRYAVNREI